MVGGGGGHGRVQVSVAPVRTSKSGDWWHTGFMLGTKIRPGHNENADKPSAKHTELALVETVGAWEKTNVVKFDRDIPRKHMIRMKTNSVFQPCAKQMKA